MKNFAKKASSVNHAKFQVSRHYSKLPKMIRYHIFTGVYSYIHVHKAINFERDSFCKTGIYMCPPPSMTRSGNSFYQIQLNELRPGWKTCFCLRIAASRRKVSAVRMGKKGARQYVPRMSGARLMQVPSPSSAE